MIHVLDVLTSDSRISIVGDVLTNDSRTLDNRCKNISRQLYIPTQQTHNGGLSAEGRGLKSHILYIHTHTFIIYTHTTDSQCWVVSRGTLSEITHVC